VFLQLKHYLPRGGARLLRDTDEAYKRFCESSRARANTRNYLQAPAITHDYSRLLAKYIFKYFFAQS